MNIVFLNRNPNLWTGGDVVYICDTMNYLVRRGHFVTYVWDSSAVDLSCFDIVHLVHCTFEWAYEHFMNAKKKGCKIVLSPIFYPYHSYKGVPTTEILDGVDLIICSTEREKEMLSVFVSEKKMVVIPRGVDFVFSNHTKSCENYVLTVGRWEGGKRQDMVIRACKELGIPYVGVGPVYNRLYLDETVLPLNYGEIVVREVSRGELIDFYSGAKVCVVASKWEEFSLVVLEAGLNGCNLVVSENVGAKEYFNDIEVFVCDDYDGLKKSIMKEFSSERDHKGYSKYIKENFLIDSIVEKYEEVYRSVL